MMTIREGYFRMLNPKRSTRGFILCGAIVGVSESSMYTCRVQYWKDVPKTEDKIRKQILKDHPGIIEEWAPSRMLNMGHKLN